ncbi:MAG: DUF5117 domain-containing protein [Gemmatimonadetes bacterium]|nr:DUF5117 domain-containing protein [Gemmatimonadota bacterium]
MGPPGGEAGRGGRRAHHRARPLGRWRSGQRPLPAPSARRARAELRVHRHPRVRAALPPPWIPPAVPLRQPERGARVPGAGARAARHQGSHGPVRARGRARGRGGRCGADPIRLRPQRLSLGPDAPGHDRLPVPPRPARGGRRRGREPPGRERGRLGVPALLRLPLPFLLLTLAGCSLLPRLSGPSPASARTAPTGAARDSAARGPGVPDRPDGRPGLRPYEQVVTRSAVTSRGFLITHRVGEELFFEVPRAALNRELILLARREESSGQSQNASFGGGPELVLELERAGDRVIVRQKRYDVNADSTAAIWSEVEGMRRGAVLAVLPVRTYGPDSAAVVQVTDLFVAGPREVNGMESVARDRSWLESAVAHESSVEIEAMQTGRSGGPALPGGPGAPVDRTVTQRMHFSLAALPEHPMRPRLEDRRVGFLTSGYTDYGTSEHGAKQRRFIHRYRLEPSDTAAFLRGEPVAPVRPITFWIDPATPDWLKPWVKLGVEAWREAFVGAGYKDAIEARVAPADDPDFHLAEVGRSVVYWRPSAVENATADHVVDPRSGEILKGEVNIYHDVQSVLRNWYFTQVGPLDPRAQRLPLPDTLMGRLVEYVVTHEVGHALGFPHNMKASAMYPPDSLRSASFLERMGGHVATLMDYSRFDYVAQPEDNIPPDLLVPRLGPYDRFAIMWGYRPILDAATPQDERPALDRWASEQDTIPWLRFSTLDSPNDPYDLTEAVGDADAMKSSRLGLQNLERVMKMLLPVAEQPGQDYALLDELYEEAVAQWGRYMGHVAAVIGGAETQERYGTGPRFTPVARARQREAMSFLSEEAFRTPQLLLDPAILRRIEADGAILRIRGAQSRVLATLLNRNRLNRLVEYEAIAARPADAYTVGDLVSELHRAVWAELDDPMVRVDVYRRNLQRAFLETVDNELTPPAQRQGVGGVDQRSSSDVRPVLRGELRALDRELASALPRAADQMTRLHLEDARAEIARILDPQATAR